MRLAEVAPPWLAVPPTGYGGIESIVSLLADGLAARGHEVTLFATGDSHTRARLEFFFAEAPGTAAIESIWPDSVQTLFAFRQADRFDLIHTHSRFSAVVAGALVEVPVVHTLHSDLSPEMQALYSLVGDRTWFVAISEAQRSHMPDLHYGGVVYNGIDVESYPFRKEKDDFLLFLGRAGPQKGAHLAVRAAREAGTRIVMAMKIAEPGEREHWNEVVKPEVPADATVVSEIGFDEKVDLLARAKAVLFPIDWDEPFGLVMTESMACGTPVIATPRGSVPEVVVHEETGFIVSVENYPQEAAAMLRRLDEIDPAACRARVEERFTADVMVSGYEAVFERALGSAEVAAS
jgi:glycosyltransferase involved in cell wall biosynthesis